MKRKAEKLYFSPCMPKEWTTVKIRYRYMETIYHVELLQQETNSAIIIDGNETTNDFISLVNDGIGHQVKVIISINKNKNFPENIKKTPLLS
jgi:cyclic beta-1,2-glucan synthetase